jgi:hypothetical protein
MDQEPQVKPIAPFRADPELARRAGKAGAAIVKERYGPDHFRTIAAAGGRRTAASHGREHMAAIGKLGGSRPKKRKPDWEFQCCR